MFRIRFKCLIKSLVYVLFKPTDWLLNLFVSSLDNLKIFFLINFTQFFHLLHYSTVSRQMQDDCSIFVLLNRKNPLQPTTNVCLVRLILLENCWIVGWIAGCEKFNVLSEIFDWTNFFYKRLISQIVKKSKFRLRNFIPINKPYEMFE